MLEDILPGSAEPPKKKTKKTKKKKGSGKSKKSKAKKGKGKKSKAKKTPEVAEEEVTDSVNGKRKAEGEPEEGAGDKKRAGSTRPQTYWRCWEEGLLDRGASG